MPAVAFAVLMMTTATAIIMPAIAGVRCLRVIVRILNLGRQGNIILRVVGGLQTSSK